MSGGLQPLRAVTDGVWAKGDHEMNEHVAVEEHRRLPFRSYLVVGETLECGHHVKHDPPKVERPGRARKRRCLDCYIERVARAREEMLR